MLREYMVIRKERPIWLRLALALLVVMVVAPLIFHFTEFEYGRSDFFNHHGIFFLIFVTLFPRLTLLFSSVATGGVLWWLAWLFVPRFLVSFLATIAFWHTNPILVVISWIIAFGGETTEKVLISYRPSRRQSIRQGQYTQSGKSQESRSKVIEADYEVKD